MENEHVNSPEQKIKLLEELVERQFILIGIKEILINDLKERLEELEVSLKDKFSIPFSNN